MKITTLLLLTVLSFGVSAQSMIQKMYTQKRFKEITAMAPDAAKYGGPDLFVIGQSFIRLEDDAQALEMFSQAINKGYKNEEVYYARGVAQENLALHKAAQESFRQALFYSPLRKKIVIAMAASYYNDNNLDSALAVYERIEKYWGDFLPAVLMVCQIEQEMQHFNKAVTCYYSKLVYFKRDPYAYKQALNSIMRMEWHNFKNYNKAEIAIKNLMAEFPEEYENNMLLMQLYNFTGRYSEAHTQEDMLMKAYKDIKLKNSFYTKGAMLMEQFDSAQYTIEVYRNFQPEKDSYKKYKAYIFNFDGTRALGRVDGFETDSLATISGYNIDEPLISEMPLTYEAYKQKLLAGLFLPELSDNDTINPK